MLDAIALGELLIDFATVDTDRDGYPTLAAHPGGAPGNFLAALHAYGCSGAMLGKVGADTFGDLLCATLAQAGIRTEGIVARSVRVHNAGLRHVRPRRRARVQLCPQAGRGYAAPL